MFIIEIRISCSFLMKFFFFSFQGTFNEIFFISFKVFNLYQHLLIHMTAINLQNIFDILGNAINIPIRRQRSTYPLPCLFTIGSTNLRYTLCAWIIFKHSIISIGRKINALVGTKHRPYPSAEQSHSITNTTGSMIVHFSLTVLFFKICAYRYWFVAWIFPSSANIAPVQTWFCLNLKSILYDILWSVGLNLMTPLHEIHETPYIYPSFSRTTVVKPSSIS